jgi:hypothetical protein
MTNWTFKQKSDNDFMSSFSPDVQKYLGIQDGFPSGDPARWLLDSFQLLNENWSNTYGDYSFLVVPASKALENWIFKIAKDLGIDIKNNKAGVVRDQIESELEATLSTVEEKLGKSIKIDIAYLRNFIQEYRNDIVHCEKRIDSVGMAKSKVSAIYERINSVTDKLLKANLISEEEIKKID